MSASTFTGVQTMKLWKLAPLLLGSLVLGGCSNMHHDDQDHDANRATGSPDSHPANPYSGGGFSDPGPNYPATGH
jgi:hypothetical protein